MQVGWLRQLMVVAFISLLVCGDQKEAAVAGGVHNRSPNTRAREKQQQQQQQQRQRLRHSFDVYFSSKRKVPNASDPLHNR
jgi:hypothetical protein